MKVLTTRQYFHDNVFGDRSLCYNAMKSKHSLLMLEHIQTSLKVFYTKVHLVLNVVTLI